MSHALRKHRLRVASAICTLAVAASVAACGGTDASTADGQDTYKIGVFLPANDNAYLQAEAASAEAAAKELGVEVTVTSSSWDSQAQNAAFQLAQQRKTYDAWIVTAVSPSNQCATILKAAKSGIPVVMAATAICDDNGYTEGTLAFVGEQNSNSYDALFGYVKDDAPAGNLAVIIGPQLDYASETAKTAAEKTFAAGDGDVKLSTIQNTDYLAETAYQAAQTLLQSDPNLTAIASIYSGMTRGVVQAVEQSGRDVAVYDSNGDSWTKEQIQGGTIRGALAGTPATDVSLGMKALVDHLDGKDTESTINPFDGFTFPGAPIITPDNVTEWTPEY